MPPADSSRMIRSVAISLSTSLILLGGGIYAIESLSIAQATSQILTQLLRLMFLISLGLTIGLVIEATGWTRYLAVIAAPVFRFAHLGPRCSAAFSTAIFSGVAANAMLNSYYLDGKIDRRQLFLANFINHFPAYFLHLPTTFFIVVPLTRWAGGIYFALTFTALLVRSAGCIIYGHLFLPPITDDSTVKPDARPDRTEGPDLSLKQKLQRRLPRRIAKVAVYVVPIYIAVYLVNAAGGFDLIRDAMAHWVVSNFLPMGSLSVIIMSFVAEFTSGFAAAGALLDAGVLTVKQTALALLIGNILAFPMRALRHQLPRYLGIFTPKLGTQILLGGQLLRVVSLMGVGLAYYILF